MDESILTDKEIEDRLRAEERVEKDRFELETSRSRGAKAILEDPLVVEAFANLEEVYMHALRYSPVDQPKLREAARWRLEALELFRNELRHVLDTGMIAVRQKESEDELGAWLAEDVVRNG